MEEKYKQAVLWDAAEGGKVRCKLCAWRCLIGDGKQGHCMVRQNIGGVLYSLNYDKVCAANIDPIEKKPLFHFMPGSKSFSISTPGCNFQCVFCQNWQISQQAVEEGVIEGQALSPAKIVESAVKTRCGSISYTYTEPTVFMELCAETGTLAKEKGLLNVFVSNGYQTHEAIDIAKGWLDGINVDLKGFSEDFYRRLCKASLQPVLDTISYIAKETDIWMEVTTLLVPGENDSAEELKKLADWLAANAGEDVPWHVSRFYPQYKMDDRGPTPIKSLETAYEIGKAAGLRYVYLGNVAGEKGENTYCYSCGEKLIERFVYRIVENKIKNGSCPKCGSKIAGLWE